MTRSIALIILSLTLIACSKKEELGEVSQEPISRSTAESAKQFLAYEHQITIETEHARVPTVYKAGIAACNATQNSGCMVLDSHLSIGDLTRASIKMRVNPNLVKGLIESMSKFGTVSAQSTTVEDLATPISDNAKKLEMLTSYRSKLETLQAKPTTDVDAAIKLTKELAQVQSDIDALNGQQAHLIQRVKTELLTISFESELQRPFLGPIQKSISQFSTNLSMSISTTINGIAFLLPWIIATGLIAWPVRKLWLRSKPKR